MNFESLLNFEINYDKSLGAAECLYQALRKKAELSKQNDQKIPTHCTATSVFWSDYDK